MNLPSLPKRPRRNRRNASIRALIEETTVSAKDLVQPVFLLDSEKDSETIDSLPGIKRMGLDPMKREFEHLQSIGICGVALFPVLDNALKDESGSVALDPDNYFYRSLKELKREFPDLVFFVDVALDPYTSHGHDGLISDAGEVENDSTVRLLAQISCLLAETGVEYVAPSDMMDGRIGAIRAELDTQGFTDTAIMAYSAKYASACYGPFRDAVGSSLKGKYLDKKTYQLTPGNSREAIQELLLDTDEGADMVMVKPAGWYLDIISSARKSLNIPVSAYQVSGEYAMIHAAAERGWMSLQDGSMESMISIKRSGADVIFTYFTRTWNQLSSSTAK